MNQFFSAIDVHIDDRCLLDATEEAESPFLASLGIDNMIYRLNVQSGEEGRYNLEQQITFDAMAIAPDASHCIFGGKNNAVLQFNFADGSTFKLCEATGNITALKYAPSGRYIAVGSEQGKALIYEPGTGKREKCRPGHLGTIWNMVLSKSGYLLASIGADQHALIYKISESGQPMEVARQPITKMENCSELKCSFNFTQNILFVAGAPQLQKIECIQNRWDLSKSRSIMHASDIIMVEVVKPNTLVTSTLKEFCVWSIKQEQKLFEIQQFCLTRVVSVAGKFYGSHNDGKIYEYRREIKEQEPMDIEPDSASDKIEFDVEEPQAQQQGDQEQSQQQEEQKEVEYRQYKKSKADKMITCYPQPPISNATQLYNDSRFLFVNIYGCVIERQQGDEQKFIDVQLEGVNKKQMKFVLAKNKDYSQFSINELGVAYAGQKEFGFRPSTESNHEQWHLEWPGVEAIAMGSGWVAAAKVLMSSEIKVFDMIGHEIRTFSFDRQLVAMRAFENILAVVYHESVPMYDCQQLAMQLYMIDSQIRQVIPIASAHVPVTRKSLLRWLDFSREGMLFSQDQVGVMRAFSLETSEWTQISVDDVEGIRKVWVIGIKDHTVNYWKTTDADPEPTVAPRFQVKVSEFSIPTVGSHPEDTQELYQKLAWRRYALDHEKARTRLWANLKISRQKNNLFFGLSDSILTEKRIAQLHIELDEKYFPLIEKYLKSRENLRAFVMSQNCIRSMQVSRKIVDLFDYENQRSLAIQFQQYCDEKQKEIEYEQMQDLAFLRLREEAEKCIKPRHEDPMKRTSYKKPEPIPSFSQSSMNSQQFSDHSVERLSQSRVSNLSQNSLNSQQVQNKQADNPFLKRKSTHESVQNKKKEISEHIEKFGLRQKADKKSISGFTAK